MEFILKRGESLTILLDDMDSVAATINTVTAHLRPGTVTPPRAFANEDAAAIFAVTPRASAGVGDPAGWSLVLTPAITVTLPLGSYVVDARIAFAAGTVLVTEPLAIRVIEPATVPA